MKFKIKNRLFLYFGISLLIFALLIGVSFGIIFSKYNMDSEKKDLKLRATTIAETLAGFDSTNSSNNSSGMGMMHSGMGHGQGGYGAYLKFIDDIAMTDVWVVNSDLKQIEQGSTMCDVTYDELPDGAESIILKAMDGEVSFTEDFSEVIGSKSITVAAPIVKDDNSVDGVVLLHRHIDDISGVTNQIFFILAVSIGIAVILSFFIASKLSSKFTKPLESMKVTAKQISEGDFEISTGINQDDEIGDLAKTIDEMAVKLNVASKESENLDKLRTDFIANISHELRTPVTVLRSSLEALCDGVVTDSSSVNDYHNQMLTETIYLERLVSDLLDLSKLQNTDFNMDITKINLIEVVKDSIRSMKQLAKKKNVDIVLDSTESAVSFMGDYGRIRQMFTVVINNAIKFSPENSIVNISIKSLNDTLTVKVTDNGCGIPKKDLPYIFERFYKEKSELNKSGTGLGLAITKQIADRHDVLLTAKSDENGTSVSFGFNLK